MKILIVDDAREKYEGIVEEFKLRQIEVEFISPKDIKIQDIAKVNFLILSMVEAGNFQGKPLLTKGEKVLRCMESAQCRIPTLIISANKNILQSNYGFVYSQMKDCKDKGKVLSVIKKAVI